MPGTRNRTARRTNGDTVDSELWRLAAEALGAATPWGVLGGFALVVFNVYHRTAEWSDAARDRIEEDRRTAYADELERIREERAEHAAQRDQLRAENARLRNENAQLRAQIANQKED